MPTQSNQLFYLPDVPVPDELRTTQFLLRPLRVTDVEQDYEAVMESRVMLRLWGGGDWPWDAFTLEDNWNDLAMHQQEQEERVAFTYTVLDPTGSTCLGCVYISPLAALLHAAGAEDEARELAGNEAIVRFWVRSTRLAEELDRDLYHTLQEWLSQAWQFPRVLFRANERDSRQVELLQASRQLRYTLQVPNRAGRYLLFE